MVPDCVAALERGDLAGARQLTLRGGLRAVPEAVRGLADTLEVLDLSGNALEALPDWLPELSRLRVLFASRNRFDRLPAVLGACAVLEQVGFRDCGMVEVSEEALPDRLRWLTLTGNRIERLPEALGTRPFLRKLMLSGNRLERLPDSFAAAGALELLRLSNNRLSALPPFLATLPALAWLSWSGNPFEGEDGPGMKRRVPAAALTMGAVLGRGSSGEVFRADWRDGTATRPVAVKRFLFEAVSSDGAPEQERRAALRAGDHPCLVGALGVVAGDELDGALVLPLVPEGWEVLAGPPSLESCSRDVYPTRRRFAPAVAGRIAADAARGMARLHGCGLLHGDLYGHNLLFDPRNGAARLGDLGAASRLPGGEGARWAALDVRAWGILLGELIERGAAEGALAPLRDACCDPVPTRRPDAAAVVRELERLGAA